MLNLEGLHIAYPKQKAPVLIGRSRTFTCKLTQLTRVILREERETKTSPKKRRKSKAFEANY